MKVIIVDTALMTPPGGGGKTFLALCRALIENGCSVSVVTQPGLEGSIVAALKAEAVPVIDTIFQPWHLPEQRGRALATWVNSESPDVYVISVSPDAGWTALPLLNPSIGTASIAHNDVSAFYAPLQHYGPFIDCAIGVSEAIRQRIIDLTSIPAERVRYIPYGVRLLSPSQIDELTRPSAGPDQPLRIAYVGRLVEFQKRIMDFVPLAEQLVKNGISFELNFIGEGSARSDLEAAFKRAGVEQHIKMWGWLRPAEVRQQQLRFDVFALLSDHEGLPVALLEAMSHGLVPIVTAIDSGNTQLVRHAENGFVVPVGDIQACVRALKTLAEDRKLLNRLKRAAWESVQEYSEQRSNDEYVECFTELARTSKRRVNRNLPEPFPLMPSCRSKYPIWLRKIKARVLRSGTHSV